MPSLAQVVVWIIIGLLGGSLAGLMITRERKGFGILRNFGLGLAGGDQSLPHGVSTASRVASGTKAPRPQSSPDAVIMPLVSEIHGGRDAA